MRVATAARQYMSAGWEVLPVAGKIPATINGVYDASGELRKVPIWYERHPGRGVALATGRASGVWVLDLDQPDGLATVAELQEQYDKLPVTLTSRTGSGGYHLFFQLPQDSNVRNSAGRVGDGIDVRGTGGYVVLPPSPHPDGQRYQWVRGRGFGEIEPVEAPAWLMQLAAPPRVQTSTPTGADLEAETFTSAYVEKAIIDECEGVASAAEGTRNDTLNRAAYNLARFVAAGAAKAGPVMDALRVSAADAGLPDWEVERTLSSAFGARGVTA